jgi:hypothetical protein
MAGKTAAQRMAERLEQEALADPLRDLRDPDDLTDPAGLPGDPGAVQAPLVATETFSPGTLVTEDQQGLARHTLIAAWHADPTTLGFLHKGETCGCWYLSGVTVRAILPVQANDDTDDTGE